MARTETPEHRDHHFVDTEWSLVLRASREGKADEASLARLCRLYWAPLYSYVRRRGFNHHDAEDITQGFFSHVLEKRSLASAEQSRGRFRTFLLTSLRNYLINQQIRASTAKRGGKNQHVPLTELEAVDAAAMAQPASLTPDQVFDRTWALSVLDNALQQLEAACTAEGKLEWFRRVQPFLEIGAKTDSYESIAREFKMTKNAVAVAIHRLHHRYRNLVRAAVAETVADRTETEAELAHLLASLGP